MKTIFWNVDTQYDFMRNDDSFRGTLVIPGADRIESNLEKLTRIAAKHALKVVNTADWHTLASDEISDSPDFKTTFPRHCLAETKGAQYVPATEPEDPYVIDWQDEGFDLDAVDEARNIVLYKDAFNIFAGNKHADAVLEKLNPDQVVVYGVATNVCVDYAVQGLAARGKRVLVAADAIKELPNLSLEGTLVAWQKAGVTLVQTDEIEKYLE